MSTLLTGFKPFDIFSVNSSWEAVKIVSSLRPNVFIDEIEVDFLKAHFRIVELLEKNQPSSVLMCGLNPENKFRLEIKARKPHELIDIKGANEYYGNWDWDNSIEKAGYSNVEIKKSFDAGQYVCESIYWSALNHNHSNSITKNIAFLHVPPISKKWSKSTIANVIMNVLDSQDSQIS